MDPFLNILHPNGTCLSKKSLQSLQSAKEIGCCTLLMMSRVCSDTVPVCMYVFNDISREIRGPVETARPTFPNAFSDQLIFFNLDSLAFSKW